MEIYGTEGRISFDMPYSAPLNLPTNIQLDLGRTSSRTPAAPVTEVIPASNQYTIQGDAFSKAIRENTEVPVPLEDAIKNMSVIDAIFRSAKTNQWEKPEV
jgi:predicted dehydrogenase